jgi:hypothetical protein
MAPTFHSTDGPHDTCIIRLGRHDIGLINWPPVHRGRYCAYTLAGEFPSDGHPSRLSACRTLLALLGEVADGRTASRLVRFNGYRPLKV